MSESNQTPQPAKPGLKMTGFGKLILILIGVVVLMPFVGVALAVMFALVVAGIALSMGLVAAVIAVLLAVVATILHSLGVVLPFPF